MAKIAFNHVTKYFDEKTIAVQEFTLTIQDGEFVVLVGPSGCGKSTVLRLLAGLENVTKGQILINDQVANLMTPQQRNIAMVFQNYALYPHMSVRANLAFPLKMKHTPTAIITEKIAYIAEILDLSQLLERKPKQLSGGQRQRVAMGRALVRNPSVFLLDEPLSNLDAKLRAQIRTDIAKIQKRLNKTTLYVTHNQVEAMTLGNRVAVMNHGELQQIDTPEVLYDKPKNSFVAKFIGNPGMNIIPSILIQEGNSDINLIIGKQKITLLPASQYNSPELLRHLNKPIFAGIRPEAFSITKRMRHHSAIKIKIFMVEFLGHESLIYGQLPDLAGSHAGNILVARIVERCHFSDNTIETFFINPQAIYLFNAEGVVINR